MDIGSNIRKYRKEKKITITKLAELVGSQREYLSSIENGKKTPSFTMIEKIADALSVQINDLTSQDDNMSPELKRLIDNAKELPTDILNGLNNAVESINGHFKTVKKSINGIPTKYTVDLNVKPNGLTEEEELEAQRLIHRLKDLQNRKKGK